MAISWGAYVDGLQVGIELTTSDSTPNYGESVTITCRFYLQSNKTFSDNETFNWSFNGASGSLTVSNPSHASVLVLTKTATKTAGKTAQTISASGTGHTYDGGAPSESSSITVPAVSGVPNTPATPTVSSIVQQSAKVTWTAPGTNGASITGYKLAYQPSGGSWTYVTLGNVLTYTLTGLSPSTTYNVEVSANSSAGYSAYSSAASFTTLAPAAPSPPTSITASDGTTVSGGTATPGLKVSFVAGATNGSTGDTYDVAFNTTNSTTGATIATNVLSGATITAGVAAGTSYYVWVRANSTSPASTGAWQQYTQGGSAGTVTTQASGAQGDLVDRINAFAAQVGADIASMANQPVCVVYQTATQSIAQASGQTTITFGAAATNVGGMWSSSNPSKVTIAVPGTYRLRGKISMAGTTWTAGKYIESLIQVNASTVEFMVIYPPGSATGTVPCPVPEWTGHLNAGDVVTLVGTQTLVSTTFNTVAGAYYTNMTVERIGA